MPTSESEKIWKEIKALPINMFSLPNQRVEDHVTKVTASGGQLVVKLQTPSALPALEETLSGQTVFKQEERYDRPHAEPEKVEVEYPKYSMEEADGGYVMITRYVPGDIPTSGQDNNFVVARDKAEQTSTKAQQ